MRAIVFKVPFFNKTVVSHPSGFRNSQFTKNKNYSFCIPKKHKHRIGIFQSFAFDWIIPHSVLKEVLTFNISTIGDTPIFSWGIVIRIMSCAYFSRPLALAIMIFSKLIKFKVKRMNTLRI